MRGFNPALVTHMNLDLDKIIGDEKATTKNTGLLAPKKTMMDKGQDKINNPLYRVANHVKILRDKRSEMKDA
tara:strand:- start:286 stop:501 length:216 start_codon:yes stop_codon:yes gene_type:complete